MNAVAAASQTRRLQYVALKSKTTDGEFVVEAIDHNDDGIIYCARFTGPDAAARAVEYAEWKNATQ
jgi:hypothetical protein